MGTAYTTSKNILYFSILNNWDKVKKVGQGWGITREELKEQLNTMFCFPIP